MLDAHSPIQHHLVLHQSDPEQGVRRFYSLMIERNLFGTIRLVRNWGRIGTNGQEKVEEFAHETAAGGTDTCERPSGSRKDEPESTFGRSYGKPKGCPRIEMV